MQWIRPLVYLMLEGVNGIADYQCRQILGDDHYFRLAPTFPADKSIDQDEVDEIPYMVEFAEQLDITAAADWLRANWYAALGHGPSANRGLAPAPSTRPVRARGPPPRPDRARAAVRLASWSKVAGSPPHAPSTAPHRSRGAGGGSGRGVTPG